MVPAFVGLAASIRYWTVDEAARGRVVVAG